MVDNCPKISYLCVRSLQVPAPLPACNVIPATTTRIYSSMYVPTINLFADKTEIVAFMRRFNFATIITATDHLPTATHLPFVISEHNANNTLILAAHFAKNNPQYRDIEQGNPVLVVFSEPHAYISPEHYEKKLNVPTWNYIAVHAYGRGRIIDQYQDIMALLEASIDFFDPSYHQQWQSLPETYKANMAKGIVAFEIVVTDLQAKKKLSQNKTPAEQQHIITALSDSPNGNEQLIAEYMRQNKPDK